MNTKPVGVLAVLQMWIDGIRRDFADKCSDTGLDYGDLDAAASLESARAAIAELIAADEEYDAAESEYDNDSDWADFESRERLDRASTRRDAALARVKGEA